MIRLCKLFLLACLVLQAPGAPILPPVRVPDARCGLLVNTAARKLSPAGCPCKPQPGASYGLCGPGYVCAQPWHEEDSAGAAWLRSSPVRKAAHSELVDAQLAVSQAVQQQLLGSDAYHAVAAVNSDALGDSGPALPGLARAEEQYTCQPCTYGMFCPEGSTLPAGSPEIQMALLKLQCPAGKYCPNPAEVYDCPAGAFCSAGSVQPTTCNLTELVEDYPGLALPEVGPTIFEQVFVHGSSLAGNTCPANSTSPSAQCQAGWYCPEAGVSLVCPPGFFCKTGSQAPQPCPRFAYCPQGSASPMVSYGVIIAIGVTLKFGWAIYLLALVGIRMKRSRQLQNQEARDRLWRLLTSLFTPRPEHRHPSLKSFKSIHPKVTLEFDKLGLAQHDGHVLLAGVTGRFQHSRMAAVLGPMGAGKTTLLHLLLGRKLPHGKATGTVRVNGRELRPKDLQAIAGFVSQEDLVHKDLTVRESLLYSARLRLPRSTRRHELLSTVDDVLGVLQLRHIEHHVVGASEWSGISVSQRRCLSVAVELASRPSVLLMDEPSSRLDPTAELEVAQALKRCSQLGMNVVVAMNWPRAAVFNLFDDMLLLGKAGRLAYLGPSHLALPYFSSLGFAAPLHEGAAEFCLNTVSGSVPRTGNATFQTYDLFGLWQTYGLSYMRTQSKLVPSGPWVQPAVAALRADPQQLQLLEEAFDRCDRNGDGAITGPELRKMLTGLGLQPTHREMRAAVQKLATPQTGLVSKEALMGYVRHDEAHTAQGTSSSASSMYRAGSVEHYTLVNALSELSSACLPPGLLERLGASTIPAANKHCWQGAEGCGSHQPAENVGTASSSSGGGGSSGGSGSSGRGSQICSEIAQGASLAGGQLEESITATLAVRVPPWQGQQHRADFSCSKPLLAVCMPQEAVHSLAAQSPTAAAVGQLPLVVELPDSGASTPRHSEVSQLHPGTSSQASSRFTQQDRANSKAKLLPMGSNASSSSSSDSGGTGTRNDCTDTSCSLRRMPGSWCQFWVLLARAIVKSRRGWSHKLLALLVLVLAGVGLGILHISSSGLPSETRSNACAVMLVLGLLTTAFSLRVFGSNRSVFWREQAGGVLTLPYFLAHTIISLVGVALHPLLLLAVYHSTALPPIAFLKLYLVGVLVTWWCSSLGCLLSVLARPPNARAVAMAVVLTLGLLLSGVHPNLGDMPPTLRHVAGISFNRWAVEALTILQFSTAPAYFWPAAHRVLADAGYCSLDWSRYVEELRQRNEARAHVLTELQVPSCCYTSVCRALAVLVVQGLLLRLATYLALLIGGRGASVEPVIAAGACAVQAAWRRLLCVRVGRRASRLPPGV